MLIVIVCFGWFFGCFNSLYLNIVTLLQLYKKKINLHNYFNNFTSVYFLDLCCWVLFCFLERKSGGVKRKCFDLNLFKIV